MHRATIKVLVGAIGKNTKEVRFIVAFLSDAGLQSWLLSYKSTTFCLPPVFLINRQILHGYILALLQDNLTRVHAYLLKADSRGLRMRALSLFTAKSNSAV